MVSFLRQVLTMYPSRYRCNMHQARRRCTAAPPREWVAPPVREFAVSFLDFLTRTKVEKNIKTRKDNALSSKFKVSKATKNKQTNYNCFVWREIKLSGRRKGRRQNNIREPFSIEALQNQQNLLSYGPIHVHRASWS